MIRITLILLLACLCCLIGYSVNLIPLRVILKADTYYIETSLIVWLLFSLLAASVLFYGLKLLHIIWHSPEIFSRNSAVRKKNKADRLLKSGLAELLAGHYHQAEQDLHRGGRLAESLGLDAIIYYENAAIAANKQNAKARRDHYLLRARQDARQHQGNLTRLAEAEIHIQNKAYEKAANLLEKLRQEEPRNPKIIALLDEAYAKQKEWAKAWQLLPALRQQLSASEFEARKKTYAKGMLNDSAKKESIHELENSWKHLPADIRHDKEMLLQYAGSLVENDHPEEAEKLLTDEIRQTQDIELIQAYSQLRHADFRSQLNHMTQWENKHINNAIFLYAKALIAYKAKDFDTALHSIEDAIKRHQTKEAFALYAQILEARNQPEAALAAYRQSITPAYPEQALEGDLLPAPPDNTATGTA
ncbi:MAG: heme biosynthesis HemY N-terminal domain-containing protein [Cardiobacteriaceae bacterium]|nr:heme biosynthesis HemY N-terminal domain-containing protein [Cardiobacteriaceae bacterium]